MRCSATSATATVITLQLPTSRHSCRYHAQVGSRHVAAANVILQQRCRHDLTAVGLHLCQILLGKLTDHLVLPAVI